MTTTVQEFNDTLFELTDEMMGIINPSTLMTTAYSVFKNMYASNPHNTMAVDAFWDVAKDNETMIRQKDLGAMADVLRGVIPMPGMVDDVWKALSDENRCIVGDYIVVLYDQASTLKKNSPPTPENEKEEKTSTTMYSMYNDIWKDFLLHLETSCYDTDKKAMVKEAREKLARVLETKGVSTTMVFGILFPSLKPVLPRTHQTIKNEADIIRMCLPPHDTRTLLETNKKQFKDAKFPLNQKVPFSDLLDIILTSEESVQEKLGTYWHYIRLFSVCVNECPPQILGMMNQMAAFFNQGSAPDLFLRDDPAVLTK